MNKDVGAPEIIRKQQFKGGITKVTMKFTPKDGKKILCEDVDAFINALIDKGQEKHRVFELAYIRAGNGIGIGTYHDSAAFQDYYEGRVKDTQKFTELDQLEVAVWIRG